MNADALVNLSSDKVTVRTSPLATGPGAHSSCLRLQAHLFRRYATRSLEESRGLVPPYANGCDEVLSIRKVTRVLGDARTGRERRCGSALFSESGYPEFIFKICDR